MAYIPSYVHDIFVSYAHVDDQPDPGVPQGWVTTLVEGLKRRLAKKLGSRDACSLWMDHQLSKHTPLTPELLSLLQQSALLVMFLSPAYLASEWCRREKNNFLQAIENRQCAGSRLFVIELTRVDPEDKPAAIRDYLGFRFWTEDGPSGQVLTLGDPMPNPNDPTHSRYYSQLENLADKLVAELKKLRAAIPTADSRFPVMDPVAAMNGDKARAVTVTSSPVEATTVFLAEVTDDLDVQYEELRGYLEQAGYRVLPEMIYPRDPHAYLQSIDQDLPQCQLFVQLLSLLPGRYPRGYVGLQYERAQFHGKPALQWRSPKLDPEEIHDSADDRQRQLLLGATVHAVQLEEFKREVKQYLEPRSPATEARTLSFSSKGYVYLNAEPVDMELAMNIGQVLERHGIWYALPPDEETGSARAEIEQDLLDCDGLILVYGKVGPQWVRNQMVNCRKVWRNRERPLRAMAIYQGPPTEKAPLQFGGPPLLDGRQGLDESGLQMFIKAIET